jgi:hypothetical protein
MTEEEDSNLSAERRDWLLYLFCVSLYTSLDGEMTASILFLNFKHLTMKWST